MSDSTYEQLQLQIKTQAQSIEELVKELEDYKAQLRWSLNNEARYKNTLNEKFAEIEYLKLDLEHANHRARKLEDQIQLLILQNEIE